MLLSGLAACGHFRGSSTPRMSEHECMTRVMYFESNRSSDDGMLAVGTVVMNRLKSGKYPKTICGVVGQKNQFAPGVLTRKMEVGKDRAARMAKQVMRGKRHPKVQKAMFFHTAGMTFPYTNMHYLVVAGGNAFYEKRKNARRLSDPPFRNPEPAIASGGETPSWALFGRPAPVEREIVYSAAPDARTLVAPQPVRRARPAPVEAPAPRLLETLTIEDLIREQGL